MSRVSRTFRFGSDRVAHDVSVIGISKLSSGSLTLKGYNIGISQGAKRRRFEYTRENAFSREENALFEFGRLGHSPSIEPDSWASDYFIFSDEKEIQKMLQKAVQR